MSIDKSKIREIAESAVGVSDVSLAPDVILALLDEAAAAQEKIDKAWNRSTPALEGYIPGALDAWKRPVKQNLPYDFSSNPGASATQYCNGWNDSGGYWKNHCLDLQAEIAQLKAECEGLRAAQVESENTASINYDCMEMISEHLISGDLLLVRDEEGRLSSAQNVVDSVKAIQKDVERYRWLSNRSRWASTHVDFDQQGVYRQHRVCWFAGDDWPQTEGQSLDEAIDSAMGKGERS